MCIMPGLLPYCVDLTGIEDQTDLKYDPLLPHYLQTHCNDFYYQYYCVLKWANYYCNNPNDLLNPNWPCIITNHYALVHWYSNFICLPDNDPLLYIWTLLMMTDDIDITMTIPIYSVWPLFID